MLLYSILKKLSNRQALLNWQYIDRLCAKLSSFEKVIHRESFGPLTATMVPPVIIIVIQY